MIQAGLQLFRETRAKTLSMISTLSQEQMDFSPAARRWSVGEVADHLLLSEKLYRKDFADLIELAKSGRKPEVSRSSREINFSPAFLPKSFLPFLEVPFTIMNVFVPQSVREYVIRSRFIQGQNPDVATPQKSRLAADLCRELSEAVEQTAALLESNADLDYAHMIVRHPLMGSNNVLQLLRILCLHEQRHQDQITEICKSRSFPQAARTERATG